MSNNKLILSSQIKRKVGVWNPVPMFLLLFLLALQWPLDLDESLTITLLRILLSKCKLFTLATIHATEIQSVRSVGIGNFVRSCNMLSRR